MFHKKAKNQDISCEKENVLILSNWSFPDRVKQYETYREFVFHPYDLAYGDWDMFTPIALETIHELLKEYHVATVIEEMPERDRCRWNHNQKCASHESTAKRYFDFLNAFRWEKGRYLFNGKRALITLTQGADDCLLRYALEEDPMGFLMNETLHLYGYSETQFVDVTSFDAMKKVIENHPYDIEITYQNNHPILSLSIHNTPLHVAELKSRIETICNRYQKELQIE